MYRVTTGWRCWTPVELADGRDPETGAEAGSPGLEIHAVTEVEHAGRPAWEAYVRTTPVYEPRCGCCPLLRSRQVDEREYGSARGPYPTCSGPGWTCRPVSACSSTARRRWGPAMTCGSRRSTSRCPTRCSALGADPLQEVVARLGDSA